MPAGLTRNAYTHADRAGRECRWRVASGRSGSQLVVVVARSAGARRVKRSERAAGRASLRRVGSGRRRCGGEKGGDREEVVRARRFIVEPVAFARSTALGCFGTSPTSRTQLPLQLRQRPTQRTTQTTDELHHFRASELATLADGDGRVLRATPQWQHKVADGDDGTGVESDPPVEALCERYIASRASLVEGADVAEEAATSPSSNATRDNR